LSLDVANKAPQAFKGKAKATQKSSDGSPRRKLVIHGPVDDRQPNKKQKKLPIHLKRIIGYFILMFLFKTLWEETFIQPTLAYLPTFS